MLNMKFNEVVFNIYVLIRIYWEVFQSINLDGNIF